MGTIINELHKCTIEIYPASFEKILSLPEYTGLSAGFPSPAADFLDSTIDLNKLLIEHPASTFYARVKGNSMEGAGISDGDLLVIDRSIKPTNGTIAVFVIDDEFTVKRLKVSKTGIWLMPENNDYKPIKVNEFSELNVWGVVTYAIKKPS